MKSEFSIVSVAPFKGNHLDPMAVESLRNSDGLPKAEGISTEGAGQIGVSLHQPPPPLSPFLERYYARSQQMYREIQENQDNRPLLIKFSPVKEVKSIDLTLHKLSYKLFKTDQRLVRNILEASGFSQTDKDDWNLLLMGSHSLNCYTALNPNQKVNHFPTSLEVTHKDRLSLTLKRMQDKFGDEFNFTPDTFVLPEEFDKFKLAFSEHSIWIVKPTCSSQGKGIFLVKNIEDVPTDEICIISKYIDNPLLINRLKFDLRLYVLITSYEPLRIYIYEEGLARFASSPYRPGDIYNQYSHLTNYSLNKKNGFFQRNEDAKIDDKGHKWSLSALQKFFTSYNIDTNNIWARIYELIIKTIIAGEASATKTIKRLGLQSGNCFELLGFDILLDSSFKPWLLEVNYSPSLTADSPLDYLIKSNLVADMLNLVGIRAYSKTENRKIRKSPIKRNSYNSRTSSPERRREDINGILKYKEFIRDTLEEQDRRGRFVRIYPSLGTSFYDKYFEMHRAANIYLYNALYLQMMEAPRPSTNAKLIKSKPRSIARTQKYHGFGESFDYKMCLFCRASVREYLSVLCADCKNRKKQMKKHNIPISGPISTNLK